MVMTAAIDPRLGQAPAPNAPRLMIYEVELPDGSIAEIEAPEGTTEPQLMEAVRGYEVASLGKATGGLIQDAPAQGRRPDALRDVLRGGARGVEEALTGTAQLVANTAPLPAALGLGGPIADVAADQQKQYEQTSAGQSGAGTAGRLLGGIAATAPMAPLAIPAKGAALAPALARTAVGSGTIAAASTPAVTQDYWAEKAPQAAAGAALGTGILAAGRGVARVGEEITNAPRRAVNYAQERANRKPLAEEGEALAARTDIPLTPGMVSGGRAQTFSENMARQSIFTADRVLEADIRIANKALEYVNRIGKKMSPEGVGDETVGLQMQGAVRGAVKRTADAREEAAKRQYGAIHAALGGRPIVDYGRTREVLEGIANPGGTLSGDALRASQQARKLLDQMDGKPRTLQQAIKDRSFWGRGTRGDGNVFNDVSHSANRQFASQLYGAIQDDISAAAAKLDGATTAGPGLVPHTPDGMLPPGVGLGDALREADKNYRLYSEAIGALENSPMARLLGNDITVGDFLQFNSVPAEKVIAKLSSMAPTELNMVRSFMQANAPETWGAYKRLLLDQAAESAALAPASAGVRQIPLNAGQFIRALGGDKPARISQLKAIFEPEEMAEINDALQAMRRMGDKFGTNFSGTDVRTEARSVVDAFKSGSGTAVASTVGQLSGLQAVSRVMLAADGRRAVIELSKLPPNGRRAPALISYLTALAAGQQMAYPKDDGGQPNRQ